MEDVQVNEVESAIVPKKSKKRSRKSCLAETDPDKKQDIYQHIGP